MKFFYDKILNSIFFYLGWFVCIHGVSYGHFFIGPFVVAAILCFHFLMIPERKTEALFILTLAILGTLIDSIYSATGMIIYYGGYQHFPYLAPLWMTSMWALYACCVQHCLGWLQNYPLLAILCGGIGGPLSYAASIELGAAEFGSSRTLAMFVLMCVWGVVFPLSFWYYSLLRKQTVNEGDV